MGRRICLTQSQREAEIIRRRQERLAKGLAAYKQVNRLTIPAMAKELGIGETGVKNLLAGRDTSLNTENVWGILKAAGLRVTEPKENIWDDVQEGGA